VKNDAQLKIPVCIAGIFAFRTFSKVHAPVLLRSAAHMGFKKVSRLALILELIVLKTHSAVFLYLIYRFTSEGKKQILGGAAAMAYNHYHSLQMRSSAICRNI
jgi:hypothetical protein